MSNNQIGLFLFYSTLILGVYSVSSKTFLEKKSNTRELITLRCDAWQKVVEIQMEKPVKDFIEPFERTTQRARFYADDEFEFYVCDMLSDADRTECRSKLRELWKYDYVQQLKNYNYCGPRCEAFKKEWASKCAAVSDSVGGYNNANYQLGLINILCKNQKDMCYIDARESESSAKFTNWKRVGVLDNSKQLEKYRWKCYFDLGRNGPLRINPVTLDVECYSTDGKSCMWGQADDNACWNLVYKDKAYRNAKPLACGEAHKKLYGGTGYDVEGHWCKQIRDLYA